MTSPAERLGFCTLGMFIIDEIEYVNSSKPEQRIIGGAGTYAALGARLAAGNGHAQSVSWIVDVGSDFPPEFKDLIQTWSTQCIFRLDSSRLTTTAWNGYGENEHRAFKYLTPKIRLDEYSLSDEQALAQSFHMVCAPQRCMSIVKGITARRSILAPKEPRPIFVWEPVPDLCTPEEFERLREASALVDVVSPNAEELASFFAIDMGKLSQQEMANRLLRTSSGYVNTALVVREGARGCTTYVGEDHFHLRPFHQSGDRVRDPTGGGNTFLGALAMGMTGRTVVTLEDALPNPIPSRLFNGHQNLLLGLLHATISAAYAIEQVGMPSVSASSPDEWNGEPYQERFSGFLDRERSYIVNQIR